MSVVNGRGVYDRLPFAKFGRKAQNRQAFKIRGRLVSNFTPQSQLTDISFQTAASATAVISPALPWKVKNSQVDLNCPSACIPESNDTWGDNVALMRSVKGLWLTGSCQFWQKDPVD